MPFAGRDVIDIGSTRVGQDYVLGARVPLDNAKWKGPWDCAEFTSWCAYQAYGMIFGAGGAKTPAKAEPYSGYWYADAKKFGRIIDWRQALDIPGAVLIRAPATGKIGHVAFAMGDGTSTLEARGKAFGVGKFKGAKTRPWSIGCLLPGVDYDAPARLKPLAAVPKPELPEEFLWETSPAISGAAVVAVQKALAAMGIDPGPLNGVFGSMVSMAVVSFQAREGLEVDGVVGPGTAKALGLSFPIKPKPGDEALFEAAHNPPSPAKVSVAAAAKPSALASTATATTPDLIKEITRSGKVYRAKTHSGHSFIVGSVTSFTDDMSRVGLFQGKTAIEDSLQFGVYKPANFVSAFGQWAHFIGPTLLAEGNARFATLNTYDRAAFTFGAPQLAAHTPEENFIVLFRELLGLSNAALHFPELSLRKNSAGKKSVHLAKGSGFVDLEEVVLVKRPNGKKEKQLAKLMAYLNSSPVEVDDAELTAASRLMNWLRLDPKTKELQIATFIGHAKTKLARAKQKAPKFTGKEWKSSLWIMDILHQGRGSMAEIKTATESAKPVDALMKIGFPKYKERIDTVAKAVKALDTSKVLDGFEV